jgi:hypothetical protein
MITSRIMLTIALTVATPIQAIALPFCVEQTGVPPQCLYADPAPCQREANRIGGICQSNAAEFKTPAGTAPFCVVNSGNAATCAYFDRATCNTEASRQNGACVAATPAKPPLAVDPYEVKRPY